MEFQTDGEAKDIFHFQRFVGGFRYDVEVVCADFVENRGVVEYGVLEVEGKALSQADGKTYFGAEVVVAVRVFSRLFLPKFVAVDCGHIDAGSQRFE